MDYTLAQYKQPAFDQLAFDGAKEKLVHQLGYPEELLDIEYDHSVSFVPFVCFSNLSDEIYVHWMFLLLSYKYCTHSL